MTTADLTIESYDLRTAPDDALSALHALDAGFEVEARPDEPPVPFETFRARYRSMPAFRDATGWVARKGTDVAGSAIVDFDRSGNNAHVAELFTTVSPQYRRHGVGRALLQSAIEAIEADNRRLVLAYTNSAVPAGGAVMEHLGGRAGLAERESELDLEALDRSLVDAWVEQGPERAPAYELLTIEGDLPDELLEPFAALYDVSNTAPRDALEVEDEHRSPEQIRETERSRRESGSERILCIARHRDSGELAGWTELARHPAEPWRVQQYWTAVHPDHRGHALGKWLKAANVQRALERWPDARKIFTGNAYSNDAMLGINNALGFRETHAWTVWQISVEELRTYLTREPAGG